MIVSMVALGFWQLDRLDERRASNELIESRSFGEPLTIGEALLLGDEERDFVAIADSGRFLDPELVRVANRSQGGAAGDWVVGLFETVDGQAILVNRGFLTREATAAAPENGEIAGWLRASREKDSTFGGTDDGRSFRVPRLDVDAVAARAVAAGLLEGNVGADGLADGAGAVAPEWVQMAPPERAFAAPLAIEGEPQTPDPVPLPPLDEGSHLSYAFQWFTFAAMGGFVYVVILRRKAGERVSGRSGERSERVSG